MKISAVITDNASTMTAAWRILKQEYKHIIFMGCIAHGLNLLVGDIMQLNWAMKIFSNAKKIVKFFKKHTIPGAILKRHQTTIYNKKIGLKLPVKTRWGSAAICMESLLESKLALNLATMEIIHQPNIRMNVEIQNVILDQIFWENLEVLFQILNEFVIGI